MQVDDNKSYDDINVTPMVDLYLVLLLIFIIMTTAGAQSVKVKLPSAGGPTKKVEGPKTQAITINNEGKIFLNTVPVTLADLEQRLSQLKAKTPEFPVIVKGDRQMQYQGIIDVLDVIGRLGISDIGLAVDAGK